MRRIRADKLVVDMTLYPREATNNGHVRSIVHALEAGCDLPPLVIDKKSLTIIDGVHRRLAHQEHFGPACEVSVVEKEYTSRKEMFLDAIKYNAAHGAPLTRGDRQRIAALSLEYKYSATSVAAVLGMTAAAYGALKPAAPAEPHISSALALPSSRRRTSDQGRQSPYVERKPDHAAINIEMNWAAKKVVAAAIVWHTECESSDEDADVEKATEALSEAVSDYLESSGAAA